MEKKRLKLVNTIHLIILISLLLLTASMVILQISKYRKEFASRSEVMRTNFLGQQKSLIKTEVDRVIDMINYEKIQSIDLAKSNIKYRIDEAYAIAENIYLNNINSKTDTEIQKMIMCALRPIRFDHGKGYFFITRLDGIEILFSDKPEIEGTNIINIMDDSPAKTNVIVQDWTNFQ